MLFGGQKVTPRSLRNSFKNQLNFELSWRASWLDLGPQVGASNELRGALRGLKNELILELTKSLNFGTPIRVLFVLGLPTWDPKLLLTGLNLLCELC